MKVSFPLMGTADMLLRDLLTRLDTDFVVPPPTSARTLELGVKHSPEFACLPLKLTVGNLIEALEDGADTLIMAGGQGPCRFGYYAETQRRVLEALGIKDFRFLIVEPPGYDFWAFVGAFKALAPEKSIWEIWQALKVSFRKARAIDRIDKLANGLRWREKEKGGITRARREALALLDRAWTPDEIDEALESGIESLESAAGDERKEPLKIGIVGEFYIVLEPFVNFDIEEYLGSHGVYVERSVYLSDWIGVSTKNPVLGMSDAEVARLAAPYLSHFVGGEGQATIGHVVHYAGERFDGIIHFLPFTCMPEIIAKTIFPRLQRGLDIPILSLVIDEQTGKAGVMTRLEAFLDLASSKHERRLECA